MLGRHFSVNPWNRLQDGEESGKNLSVRTFRDGTKAIEVVEQVAEPGINANESEAKPTIAPYTTFNFIRTVQHNAMVQAQSIFFAKDKKDDDDVPEGF